MHTAADSDRVTSDRVPYLDGLRGLAVLLVVALHFLYQPFNPEDHPGNWFLPLHRLLGASWAGVDLFFVLSGFLLGGILLDHRAAPNLFRVFYLRRAGRILPAYYLLLSLLLVVPVFHLGGRIAEQLNSGDIPAWTFPFFLQNVAMTVRGSWGEAWIATTWSLAVEEQFYLLLPLLIRFVPLARLPAVLVSLALLAPLVRVGLYLWAPAVQAQIAAYTLLPCRWDSLLLGVLVAYAVRDMPTATWLRRQAVRLQVGWLVLAGLSLVLAWFSPDPRSVLMRSVGYSLFAVFFSLTVLCGELQLLPGRRLLEWTALRWVGRISFALYLIQLSVCGAVFHLVTHRARSLDNFTDLLLMALSFGIALAMAAVSWKFFEQPILNQARKARYQPAAAAGTA